VSLSNRWTNEVLRCQLRNNLGYIVCVLRQFLCDVTRHGRECLRYPWGIRSRITGSPETLASLRSSRTSKEASGGAGLCNFRVAKAANSEIRLNLSAMP
jgi:hypothetical protein